MWMKICGIKDRETAQRVAELGPDALGLNFYSQTPRMVEIDVAARIVEDLPEGIEPVGLFVNHTCEQIREICSTCRIRTVQLHGDEPPGFSANLPDFKVIRAFRVADDGLSETANFLQECQHLKTVPAYCLVDARVPGKYGGTGHTVSWEMLKQEYRAAEWPPLILSGGLTPKNVAAAIHTCRPFGVDVSSGVESTPAEKDLGLVKQFLAAARNAFSELDSKHQSQ